MADVDLETTSIRTFMAVVTERSALPPGALAGRRQEVCVLTEASVRAKMGDFEEDLGVEKGNTVRKVYLVTLSHLYAAKSACGVDLKVPRTPQSQG